MNHGTASKQVEDFGANWFRWWRTSLISGGNVTKGCRGKWKKNYLNPLSQHSCEKVEGRVAFENTTVCPAQIVWGRLDFTKHLVFLTLFRSLRSCSFLFTTNHLIDSSQKFSEKCSYNPNNRMPYHVIAHELYHISKQIRGIRQVRPSDSFESEHCSTAFQGEYLPIW